MCIEYLLIVQGKEEYKINKILVIGVPENSEQSNRQPTPPFHRVNMDDLCKPPLP